MKAVVKFFILSLTFFFSSSGFSQISGIVFRDYNANGTRQTGSTYNEDGVINVTVKAYNSANIEVGSVVTSSTGAYSFTGLSLPVRIEFIPPLTDDYSGVVGTGSQSSVQFHNATTTTANFGINYPDQYCHTTNPNIITTCFVNGRPAPGTSQTDVIVRHPYSATGNSYGTNNTYLGDAGTVGAVWGVAYNRETGDIFTSALAKRHAAMIDNDGNGVEDLGAIYIKTTAGTPTLWLDLATVPGVDVGLSVMPTISTRGLPNSNMGPSYDSAMFGLVGKIGLGDIEISDDNTTLYVVSLYDKKLYTIDIASKTLIGAGIPVPNPCSGGFARPFSVTYHRGKVYVGTVCDAITSQLESDLKANVYRLDGGSFTSVLSFPLNYVKGAAFEDYDNGTGLHGTKWNPWEDVFSNTQIAAMSTRPLIHPQPILANIEFDHEESMILVFNDRIGHQGGTANFGTSAASTGTTTFNTVASGDILRASLTGGVYVLENNATSGLVTTAGAGNNQGPATINGTMNGYTGTGGEYYHGDFSLQYGSSIYHKDAVSGGSTFYPGSGQVYVHVEDSTDPWSGGSYLLDNTSGAKENAYTIYPATVTDNLFGKANGLGDPELMCNIAPIEIGNRVWVDTDGDGIQDADESPLSGVTIQLVKNGSVIATATTDANGNYLFSNDASRTDTDGDGIADNIYNITQLMPDMAYIVRIPNVQGGSKQSAIGANNLTLSNASSGTPGTQEDVRDSDGVLVGNNAEVTVLTTQIPVEGANNHTFDFGFTESPACSLVANCTPTAQTSCTPVNGGASVTVTGAQGNLTYIWSSGETTVSISGKSAGTYTVTVTDDFLPGCTATCTAVVNASVTPPSVTCGKTDVTNCATPNGTATAIATNVTYLWSNSATTSTISNLSPGTYTVTVTSTTTGCTATCSAVVASTVAPPSVTCGKTDVTNCASPNGTATATATNVTYLWSNSATTSTINNLSPGTYTVTVTSTTTGCTSTCSAVVGSTVAPPSVTCGKTDVTNCATPNGTATATATNVTYLWSNSATTSTINNLSPGTYTVTVTSTTTGCTATCSAVVASTVAPPSVTCGKTDVTNCATPNGTATATATNVTYLWSNSATTSTINNLSPGTYTVTVTSTTTGCTATCSAVVGSTSAPPSVSCGKTDNSNCTAPNGSATATATNVTYLWSNSATTSTINNLSAGTYTVTVTSTTTGCTATCSAVVGSTIVNPTCNIAINTQPSCAALNGGSVTVTPSPSGTYTYTWSNGATTATVNSLAGGTYTVTVTNTSTGCTGVCQTTLNTPVNCCNISMAIQTIECLDNGTPELLTDNRLRVRILVTNSNATLTNYNVTVSGGTTITPTSSTYGTGTQFTLGPGTAGGGSTFIITATDNVTAGCTKTVSVIDPGTCDPANPECPPVKCGTATIQVDRN